MKRSLLYLCLLLSFSSAVTECTKINNILGFALGYSGILTEKNPIEFIIYSVKIFDFTNEYIEKRDYKKHRDYNNMLPFINQLGSMKENICRKYYLLSPDEKEKLFNQGQQILWNKTRLVQILIEMAENTKGKNDLFKNIEGKVRFSYASARQFEAVDAYDRLSDRNKKELTTEEKAKIEAWKFRKLIAEYMELEKPEARVEKEYEKLSEKAKGYLTEEDFEWMVDFYLDDIEQYLDDIEQYKDRANLLKKSLKKTYKKITSILENRFSNVRLKADAYQRLGNAYLAADDSKRYFKEFQRAHELLSTELSLKISLYDSGDLEDFYYGLSIEIVVLLISIAKLETLIGTLYIKKATDETQAGGDEMQVSNYALLGKSVDYLEGAVVHYGDLVENYEDPLKKLLSFGLTMPLPKNENENEIDKRFKEFKEKLAEAEKNLEKVLEALDRGGLSWSGIAVLVTSVAIVGALIYLSFIPADTSIFSDLPEPGGILPEEPNREAALLREFISSLQATHSMFPPTDHSR